MSENNNQSIEELKIKISADMQEMEKTLKRVTKQLKQTGDQGGKAFDTSKKNAEQLQSRLAILQKQLQNAKGFKEVEKLSKEIRKTENDIEKLGRKTEIAQKQMDKAFEQSERKASTLQKQLQRLERDLANSKGGEQFIRLKDRIEDTKEELDRLGRSLDKQKGDARFDSLRQKVELTRVGFQKLDNQVKQAERTNAFASWNKNLDQISNKLKGMGSQLSSFGQGMQNVGRDMTFGVSAPTVAVGGSFVKSFADFEQQIANIKAVSNTSQDELNKIEKMSIDLGKSTKFSASEVAAGALELIKAGLSVDQVINGGLEGALTMAAAGDLELAEAAEIASTALNAFRDDALEVSDAADILAGAANASATDIKEMRYGLSMTSAVAAGVGMTFEDTATALALFANNGLKGSDAGTSLKTMLLNLIPSTSDQIAEFQRLGLMTFDVQKAMQVLAKNGMKPASSSFEDVQDSLKSLAAELSGSEVGSAKANKEYIKLAMQTGAMSSAFYDANGELKGLDDIAGLLQSKLGNLTMAQRQMALETMFGTDAIRAANILYKESADGVNKMNKEMSKVTAAETAKIKMDTLKGALEEMKGALETMAIEFGKVMGPTVRKFAKQIQKLADDFASLSDEQQLNIIKLGVFVSAIGPVLLAGGTMITMLGNVVKALGLLRFAINPVGAAIAGLGVVLYKFGAFDFLKDNKLVQSFLGFTEDVKKGAKTFKDEIEGMKKEVEGLTNGINKQMNKIESKIEYGIEIEDSDLQTLQDDVVARKDKMTEAIEKAKGKQQEGLLNVFDGLSYASAFSEEEKSNLLADINQEWQEQVQVIDDLTDEYNGIIEKALTENRQIKEDEMKRLKEINKEIATMGQVSVKDLEKEQLILSEKARQSSGKELSKNLEKMVSKGKQVRDKSVKNAEKDYEEGLYNVALLRQQGKEKEADKLLKDLENIRYNAILKANSTFQGVLAEVEKLGEGMNVTVDYMAGTVETNLDRMNKATAKYNDGFWNNIAEIEANAMDFGRIIGSSVQSGLAKATGSEEIPLGDPKYYRNQLQEKRDNLAYEDYRKLQTGTPYKNNTPLNVNKKPSIFDSFGAFNNLLDGAKNKQPLSLAPMNNQVNKLTNFSLKSQPEVKVGIEVKPKGNINDLFEVSFSKQFNANGGRNDWLK